MPDVDMKKEVIDGVVAELKTNGTYVTRDEFHEGLMDVLKNVQPVKTVDFDADTPSQKRMVMEDVCKWYQVVLGEHKAWEGVTTHVGLELIPSLVAGRIVEKLDNTPFRKLVTHFPGNKGVLAAENTLPTALRMGSTRGATAETTPAHTEVSYSTYGGTAWLLLDNKLIREATPALVTYTENSMVRSINRLETYEFTLGSGGRSFYGLQAGCYAGDGGTKNNATAGIDTLAEIVIAQIQTDYWALTSPYRDNATWCLPGTVLAKIYSINVVATPIIDLPNKTIMGRPFVELPESCFDTVANHKAYSYFGDMSFFYLFEEKPISLAVTDVGKTLVTNDQTVIVAQFETDGKCVLPLAIDGNFYLT